MKVFVFGNGTLRVGRGLEGSWVGIDGGNPRGEIGEFDNPPSGPVNEGGVRLEFQDKKSALVLVEEIHLAIRNLPWEKERVNYD